MISKTFRIALMIVLAGFTLSAAQAQHDAVSETRGGDIAGATCSEASLQGTYGFLHGGVNGHGNPAAGLTQITFDPTTGTYTGEDTASLNGVISTEPLTATYAVASDCTVTAVVTIGSNPAANLSLVVTSTGFLFLYQQPGATSSGFGVKQESPACTNAGAEGNFAFETTGTFLAGAPATGPVAFMGELKLTANSSGEGEISGHIAGSENGTILTFDEEPVTGSYKIHSDCRGTATIRPKGQSAMHFSLVAVHGGKELLVLESDDNTVVSGTLVERQPGFRSFVTQ